MRERESKVLYEIYPRVVLTPVYGNEKGKMQTSNQLNVPTMSHFWIDVKHEKLARL
jgi:hypothetical protein